MALLSRSVLTFCLCFGMTTAFAQVKVDNQDLIYGYDPLLYNGRVYAYFPKPGTTGTPYIFPEFDKQGSVTLRGVTYANLNLNYDLYNQQVILNYKTLLGSSSFIELSLAWLETFEIKDLHFEIVTNTDTSKRIFQVLGSGPYQIRYSLYKALLPDSRTAARNYFFTGTEKERYVFSGDKMTKYKNNRSFIAAFNTKQQDSIRKFIRKNKIKVKKASDFKMTELINYCNTLSVL
jgi:hypothetical protein